MNKIITTILLGFILLACSDSFLDQKPKGKWTDDDYELNGDNTLLAMGQLSAAYAGFRAWSFAWPAPAIHSYITTDAEKGSTPSDGGTDAISIASLTFTAENGAIKDYYAGAFDIISKSNEALALAKSLSDTVTRKKAIIAESLVIRAAAYFRLTQAYGDVPYVTTVKRPEDSTTPRVAVNIINDGSKLDLEFAIPFLMTRQQVLSTRNQGRVTQNTARAILAKIALYEKNWNEVIKWTDEIIKSGDNNLSTPYDEIFTERNEYGPESVFEIYCDEKPNQNIYMGSQFAEIQGIRGTPNLGWGFNTPSNALMNAYEIGDPRKTATIISNGEVIDGVTVIADGGMNHKYFNRKLYPPANERGIYGRSPIAHGQWINIRLIRYSDIILMYAEAACELGMIDEALAKLEMVRARARGGNNAVLPQVTERDPKLLMDKIRHERRIELALEFERFFDLVRWGIAKQEIPNFIVGKNELFPIPQIEITNSNGILTQNPGYY